MQQEMEERLVEFGRVGCSSLVKKTSSMEIEGKYGINANVCILRVIKNGSNEFKLIPNERI